VQVPARITSREMTGQAAPAAMQVSKLQSGTGTGTGVCGSKYGRFPLGGIEPPPIPAPFQKDYISHFDGPYVDSQRTESKQYSTQRTRRANHLSSTYHKHTHTKRRGGGGGKINHTDKVEKSVMIRYQYSNSYK
jgi:hypothetical protein